MAETEPRVQSVGLGDPSQPAGEAERVYVASQWQLMWWHFRRAKAALVSTAVIAALFVIVIFCEFLSPYDPIKDRKSVV